MQSRRSRFPYPFTTWRRTFVLIPAVVVVALAAAQSASAATSPTPIVTTGLVYNVGSGSATVGGTVNSNGEAATYHFDYGTSINYTSQTISEPIVDTTPELVDAGVTGLSPNTVYHYRIEATDAWGTSYGADQTFTTTGTGTSGTPSPFASFTATAVVIHNKCGFTGMFNASASLPAEGTSITQYAWSFGDGSSAVTTSPQTFHGYHAGTYHVVLTVTDADGTSASASRAISGGSGSLYCR
jgi:PKD domain